MMICAFRRLLLTNEYRFAVPHETRAISKEDRIGVYSCADDPTVNRAIYFKGANIVLIASLKIEIEMVMSTRCTLTIFV